MEKPKALFSARFGLIDFVPPPVPIIFEECIAN
jgi:hypothetical protein